MNLIDFNKDVFSVTDVGLVRQVNEDNCYAGETPNGFLFVVCDGMGGHVGGAKASAIAVNSIVNFFTKEYYAVIHQALADALAFANKQILGVAAAQPELKGMGTTACILLLRDDKAWFAHIGDSRIYFFCNKQHQLHRLTKDHSMVQGLVDQGVISEAEAEHHPNKNRILKTLGIQKNVQPDICSKPVVPAKDDVFLICSDGLSGMVNDDILQHILEQKVSLQEKGENMLTFAKQAGGTDNITLQLIHISNSPHANSAFESKNVHYSYAANKKGKGNITKIVLISLIAIALGFGAFLAVDILAKKDVPNTQPTVVVNETPQKKAWKVEVEKRDYVFIDEQNGIKIFGPKGNKETFNGLGVKSTDSYFTVNMTVTSGNITYNPAEAINYDKNGQLNK